MRSFKFLLIVCLACVLTLAACQPTPETPAVQYKGSSLIDMISGNYEYEPEDVMALNGQVWNEEVYKTDDVNVTVNAQITTQNVKGYPAVQVMDDTESFLSSDYLKKMISYFFDGYQPYCKTMKPTKKECEMKILWYQQALSSGNVIESEVESANEQLEYYKSEYAAATDDVPFDIDNDPHGKRYMQETGMDNEIALVTYLNNGLKGIDISKSYLSYIKQTSFDYYDYEIGLSSLDNVPESVHMDAANARKIAVDSVNTIAADNDLELVRMATINKASKYLTDVSDFQSLQPECLVFYFMRSFNGVKPLYIMPSDVQFYLDEADPAYRPGIQPEYIRIVIDDSQIVEWSWFNPSVTTNNVSNNVPLMPFEKIKNIFRQQVKNRYTSLTNCKHEINIDRITLSLMKIADNSNVNDMLVIPVWDFIGTQDVDSFGIKDGGDADYTYLTINSIDGTVINRGLGY